MSTSSATRTPSTSTAPPPSAAWSSSKERAASGEYDLIILDEAIGAVSQGQWDLEQLLEIIERKPRELNLLITGHDDEKRFIDQVVAKVDLATEMRKVKHPFDAGHQARKGLDY